MKTFFIVKPGARDFGNELINRMSIYAYAVDAGARVVNRSPFGYPGIVKALHALYARYIGLRYGKCSLHAWRAPIFLPPTAPLQGKDGCDGLYFFGWVFRNPAGLAKYREALVRRFAPHPLTKRGNQIGIHLRLEPFSGFPDGEFLVPPERVRRILDEYVREHALDRETQELCIVSDLPVPEKVFEGYRYQMHRGNGERNFFLLAESNAVIGTNTTFANTAAWFGNVPHIVTTNEPVDWAYYGDKDRYFDNRFATFAF